MNKNTNLNIFLMILLINLTSTLISYGQEISSPDAGISTNYYKTLSMGYNRSMYRDFATSPLFYEGYGAQLQTGRLKRSTASESAFEWGFGVNIMNARIPENDYLQPSTGGFFGQLTIRYLQLRELNRFSSEKNNIKLGGIIQTNQNFRLNPNLMNNSVGVENISNLMASGQITRDISRDIPRQLNLWLFKPSLKPVKRDLRAQFNVGVVNLNYRPGYAYAYDSEVIGLETNPLSWVLSNYKWSLNGWRFNTELEYITYLPNGNATSWTYVWDAANAPGRFENLQLAVHQIRYTYYFQTKTR
jgi:hypothetical protein